MARPLGADSDIEKMVRLARAAGWTVRVTKATHVRWQHPTDPSMSFYSSLTPRGHRTYRTIKSRLRKGGVRGIR